MPVFDEKDALILNERRKAFDAREGARVGDFVLMPDGTTRRFTHDWGDDIQTTCKGFYGDSFYLGNGYASYSGGLDPAIPKAKLTLMNETKPGGFWFFHHNHRAAHNGVYFSLACRVFKYEGADNA